MLVMVLGLYFYAGDGVGVVFFKVKVVLVVCYLW